MDLQLMISLKKPGINRICVGERQTFIEVTAIHGQGKGWKVGEWWDRPVLARKWFEKHENEEIRVLPCDIMELDIRITDDQLGFVDLQRQTQFTVPHIEDIDKTYIRKRLIYLHDLSRPVSKIVAESRQYRSTAEFKAFKKRLDGHKVQ